MRNKLCQRAYAVCVVQMSGARRRRRRKAALSDCDRRLMKLKTLFFVRISVEPFIWRRLTHAVVRMRKPSLTNKPRCVSRFARSANVGMRIARVRSIRVRAKGGRRAQVKSDAIRKLHIRILHFRALARARATDKKGATKIMRN